MREKSSAPPLWLCKLYNRFRPRENADTRTSKLETQRGVVISITAFSTPFSYSYAVSFGLRFQGLERLVLCVLILSGCRSSSWG